MYRPGKAAYPIGYRGFESLPFRQRVFPCLIPEEDSYKILLLQTFLFERKGEVNWDAASNYLILAGLVIVLGIIGHFMK